MTVTLSDSAAAAIRSVVASAPGGPTGLRIQAETGGCSGVIYRLGLVAAPQEGDAVIDLGDARVFIDAASGPLLDGTHVDFLTGEAPEDAGFLFDNPTLAPGCSCGRAVGEAAC